MRAMFAAIALAFTAACGAVGYDVEERSIAQLQADLETGAVNSAQLCEA